ncbi:MAG: hypothetical protein ACYDG2_22935 [Ruminiclostridium sp.]
MENIFLDGFNFEELLPIVQSYYGKNKKVYVDIVGHDEKKRISITDTEINQKMNIISCAICGDDVLRKNEKEYYPSFISFIYNDGQEDMKKIIFFKENDKYVLCGKKPNTCKFFDLEYDDINIIKKYNTLNEESCLDVLDNLMKSFNVKI